MTISRPLHLWETQSTIIRYICPSPSPSLSTSLLLPTTPQCLLTNRNILKSLMSLSGKKITISGHLCYTYYSREETSTLEVENYYMMLDREVKCYPITRCQPQVKPCFTTPKVDFHARKIIKETDSNYSNSDSHTIPTH